METQVKKDVRYPRQIFSAKREMVILSVDNYLSRPDERDTVPPLEMHSPYSRFLVTIIDKSGKVLQTPKANIPAGDVPGIVELSRLAMIEKARFNSQPQGAGGELSIGYTQQILIGSFRGKTPAEILLDDPASKDSLLKTRDFLADKADKYASNRKQMEAIDDAVALLNDGKLERISSAPKSGSTVVYSVDHKYMRDTNEHGHRLFYGMNIVCQYGNKYPWELTIENTYAPEVQGPKGGLIPKMEEKSSQAKCTFRMNDMEWMQFINRIEADMRYFESSCYGTLYKEAITIDGNHRKSAKSRSSESSETKAA